MSRSILAGAAIAAALVFVPPLPAAAQNSSSIIVSTPAPRPARDPRNAVNPPTLLSASVAVETRDLDLRTASGRSLLDQRIRVAADAACDQVDLIDPPSGPGGWNPDSGDCRHLAVKRAALQRWAVIRAAG